MGNSLSEAVYDARVIYEVTKKMPGWCPVQHWNELLTYWKSPKFLKRSKAAKENRSKAPRACHTTGSKTMERASIEKDRYVEDCIKDFGEDRSNWPVVVDPEKWMHVVGSPKKGRVMGLSVHVYPEELGFNTRKRSLFPRVGSSSQESRMEVIELRDELDEVKKIAKDATEKCTQLQALVESQRTQNAEFMELVRSQLQINRSNQDCIGSSSIGGEGRHTTNEDFNIDDLLRES